MDNDGGDNTVWIYKDIGGKQKFSTRCVKTYYFVFNYQTITFIFNIIFVFSLIDLLSL